MDMNTYQRESAETAIYPGQGTVSGLAYVGLGLGEAGEVQGKIKKVIRDNGGEVADQYRIAIAAELGDLLWYIAQTATEIDISLSVIAHGNLSKLADRQARGVIGGSGDNR